MKSVFQLAFLFLLINSCTPEFEKYLIPSDQIEYRAIEVKAEKCNHYMHYEPDSNTTMRNIRVNVHIFRDDNGEGNFDDELGTQYAKDLIAECNKKLAANKKMRLPLNNETPVLPTKFRYVLTPNLDGTQADDDGIYFHNDSKLYWYLDKGKDRNFTSHAAFQKYGVDKGKVLNILIFAHHKDSVVSPTYRNVKLKGIAFARQGFIKVAGLHAYYYDTMGVKKGIPVTKGAWFCAGHINHEIGHVLSLMHTWRYNDGCDDTPKNPNCWAYNKNPPCDKNNSNNVMDYNTYQTAWTPCQLGRVHHGFSRPTKSFTRRLLEPTWCAYQKDKSISVETDDEWIGFRDIEGDVIIESGATLTIHCGINMPKGGKIKVKPDGVLILNGSTIKNDCGEQWGGIEVWKKGKTRGRVIYQNGAEVLNTGLNNN